MKNKIYKKIKNLYSNYNGYSLENKDTYYKKKAKNNSDLASTYGEIVPQAVSKMIDIFKVNENDVFFDLGCGNGKVVTQYYLETNCAASYGVEFSTTRYKQCLEIKEKIKKENARQIDFFRGNFAKPKIDLSKGTLFYLCSTCFSSDVMYKIWTKINQSKNLKAIMALTRFPENCDFSRLKHQESTDFKCTWATSTGYIYWF